MTFFDDGRMRLEVGDAWSLSSSLEPGSVQAIITSPPYWGLRDYGIEGQSGLEPHPDVYAERLVGLMRLLRPALADDGLLWLNIGDTYVSGTPGMAKHSGALNSSPKLQRTIAEGSRWALGARPDGLPVGSLAAVPWRTAIALQADGWILRSCIIWHKPDPLPENMRDRPTTAHEYIFMLAKQRRYYYDHAATLEPAAHGTMYSPTGMRNPRSVWTVPKPKWRGSHSAVMPAGIVDPCIRASTRPGDLILDPFAGSATVLERAALLGRRAVGFELNPEYAADAVEQRLSRVRYEDGADGSDG